MIKLIMIIAVAVCASSVFAHPGLTAKDGCHYCRTSCDKWGVPWNVRHCHYKAEPFDFQKTKAKPQTKRIGTKQ